MSVNRSAVVLRCTSDKQVNRAAATEREHQSGWIDIVNPTEYEGWDDLLLASEDCTFFHTAAWAKVLSETYNYKPVYFTVTDADKLIAMVPMMEINSRLTGRRGISLPFTDYCEPLVANGFDIQNMTDFIKEYGSKRRWKCIEARGGTYPGVTSTSFYVHTLDINASEDQIFSRFKSNTRRNITKAIRDGVQVRTSRSIEAVKEYYRLHCITRKRHGLPPQPYSFFEKIHEHIISKDTGRVVLASYDKENIAGSVFFDFNGKSLYKFGASDYAYQRFRPADLVMWEGIKWSIQNEYHSFCFGRTAMGNTGLRQFKTRWGTDERIVEYYKFDFKQDAFVKEPFLVKDSHNRLFRKMPIPVLKAIGSMLYRHIG